MKYILPSLLTLLTRHARYKPNIIWSNKSWTHNFFRLLELVFWRKIGVRCEILSSHYKDETGWHTIHSPQTLEGACAIIETAVRSFFHKLEAVRIMIHQPQFAGLPIAPSPFMFAVAFDQLTSNTASPSSFSVTVTGSNTVMVAMYSMSGATNPTSVTYNSVGLTNQISATVPVAGDAINCWTLVGTSTGSNTLASSGGTPTGTQAGSYTGVGAVSGANSDTSGDPTTATYTVGVANSFVVSSGYGRNGPHALTASTGIVNDRYGLGTSAIGSYGDSGAVSSNTSISWSNTGSPNPNDTAQVGIVIEPVSAASAVFIPGLLVTHVG